MRHAEWFHMRLLEVAELFAQREKSGVYVPREKYFQDEEEHKVSTAHRDITEGSWILSRHLHKLSRGAQV